MALLTVENGPRPPQKHHEAGSLLNPIAVLFPSSQFGAGVIVEEVLLVFEAVWEVEDDLPDEASIEVVENVARTLAMSVAVTLPVSTLEEMVEFAFVEELDALLPSPSPLEHAASATVHLAQESLRDCCSFQMARGPPWRDHILLGSLMKSLTRFGAPVPVRLGYSDM